MLGTGSHTLAGKYRLIAELGHGGMAHVLLALGLGPAGFNKLVVIKQIRDDLAEDPEFLAMFLDEARLAARLNHPNVVQTNEVGEDAGRYFIAMEYLEGQPYNRVLQRFAGALPIGVHLKVVAEVLAGLHHAHEVRDFDGTPLQIVHRDISPHNVFVTYAGQVKIVDFGVAKALTQSAQETRQGVLKGKVGYMAPEQVRGERVDRRADVFAVGVMLWETLVGRRMFKGMSDIAILHAVLGGKVPSPRSAKPDVPEVLERICMKALSERREDRYETAADMQAEIEAAIESLGARVDLRGIGRQIAAKFEVERTKIQKVVETHLAEFKASGDYPSADATSGSHPRLPAIDAGPTSQHPGTLRSEGTPTASLPTGTVTPVRVTTGAGGAQGAPQPSLLGASLSSSPQLETPPNRTTRWIVVGAALSIVVGGSVAFLLRGNGEQPQPQPQPTAASAPTGGPVDRKATLRIESAPAGATVSEDGRTIGTTPIDVELEPAGASPRRFRIALDGYAPQEIEQGPSSQDVRVVVPLSAASTGPTAEPTASARGKPVAKGRPTSAAANPPPPQPPPLDIRINR